MAKKNHNSQMYLYFTSFLVGSCFIVCGVILIIPPIINLDSRAVAIALLVAGTLLVCNAANLLRR